MFHIDCTFEDCRIIASEATVKVASGPTEVPVYLGRTTLNVLCIDGTTGKTWERQMELADLGKLIAMASSSSPTPIVTHCCDLGSQSNIAQMNADRFLNSPGS